MGENILLSHILVELWIMDFHFYKKAMLQELKHTGIAEIKL